MIPDENKNRFLEELAKTGIIGSACRKTGISRATVYRFKRDDIDFRKELSRALLEGREFMSDAAESVIIKAIKDGDFRAAKYYLEHNSPRYMDKKITVDQHKKEYTDAQQAVAYSILEIMEAVKLFREKHGNISFKEWLERKNPEDEQKTKDQ